MALQDHFRPPLSLQRHWHAFHNAWSTYIASLLNQHLPEGYFAEANVQFGIEIDVAAFEEEHAAYAATGSAWTVPAPTLTLPISLVSDIVEVQIFDREGGPTLAGAIELVSPANKDRPAHRDAFTSKCVVLLQQGIGLVIVDVVTDRSGNLHDELLSRLGPPRAEGPPTDLYAVAYRPVERSAQPTLDVWQHRLALGQPLPTVPLWLRGGICLPVALDETYQRTCQELRIPVAGR